MFATMLRAAILLTCILLSGEAWASEPSKRERIYYYFEVNGLMNSVDRQVDSFVADSKRVSGFVPCEFWADDRLLSLVAAHKRDLIATYVTVADRQLSNEELDLLIDFLETDLGRKFLELNNRLLPLYDETAAQTNSSFIDNFTALMHEYTTE